MPRSYYIILLLVFIALPLQAQDKEAVSFELNRDNLCIYNQEMKKVVEPGDFTIYLGSSSRDEDLKRCTLTVI
jgi:beta-glucosidase